MATFRKFLTGSLITGLLIAAPVYLCVLLVLKGMASVAGLAQPLTAIIPDRMPAETLLSFVMVAVFCLVVGILAKMGIGKSVLARMEWSLFERLPGYSLIRGMAFRMSNDSRGDA